MTAKRRARKRKVKDFQILRACKAVLEDDSAIRAREVEKDLDKQILDYNAGIRTRKGRLPKYMLPVLEEHKLRVEKGFFRWNPVHEIKELDRIQERSAGTFSSSDFSYMCRRRKKAQQNHLEPTPYFRVCGERRGGLITKFERTYIKLWEVLDKIKEIK